MAIVDTRLRVLIHDAIPDPLAETLAKDHPDIQIETCDTYEGLNDVVRSFAPNIVYTIRFSGTPNFPKDVLLGPSKQRLWPI